MLGREANRPAGYAVNQIRFRNQPQDCQGARAGNLTDAARARRRVDRLGSVIVILRRFDDASVSHSKQLSRRARLKIHCLIQT